jgi:DNA-directed RNA polymerase alpha subunit
VQASFMLDKGTGLSLGTALRHIALHKIPFWRPIAFSLNRKINVIDAGSSIVEDAWKIMSGIRELRYITNVATSEDMLVERYRFTGSLKASDLKSNYFQILGEDYPLITCLDDSPVELTVVYRNGNGLYDEKENAQFLADRGRSAQDYFVMSSRHTDVRSFTFEVKEGTVDENLIVDLSSDVQDESKILSQTLKILRNAVIGMDNSFAGNSEAI